MSLLHYAAAMAPNMRLPKALSAHWALDFALTDILYICRETLLLVSSALNSTIIRDIVHVRYYDYAMVDDDTARYHDTPAARFLPLAGRASKCGTGSMMASIFAISATDV